MSTHLDMSYGGALEAAGATVHVFEQFGSYQGDWWALVTYKGETGWVNGSYGSCSGCDALQAEFDWGFGDAETGWGDERRAKTEEELADERARFADFGRGYLEDCIRTQEQAETDASRNLEWDSDAHQMLDFIKRHAPHADATAN